MDEKHRSCKKWKQVHVNNSTLDVQNRMTEWKFRGPHELLGENGVRDMSNGWEPLEKMNYFDLFSGWGVSSDSL